MTTPAVVSVGGTFEGTLNASDDQDWIRLDLTAGDTVQINLTGVDHSGSTLGALLDPYLRLYDSAGNLIAVNDDGGPGYNSQITFTAGTTGSFFIEADSWRNLPTYPGFTGDYEITVQAATPPPPASPLDAIQGVNSLNTNDPIQVYFAVSGDQYSDGSDTYTATGVNAYEQGQLWSIFEGVEEFINIDFTVTTNRAQADLEWATSVLPSVSGGTLLGYFFFPSSNGSGGHGVLNNNGSAFPYWNSTPGGTLDTGGFMYGVAIHELGHGLGLGHPQDTGNGTVVMQGVTGSSSRGDFNLNMSAYTAMSYNEGSDVAGVASSVASTGHGATFSPLDIAALQAMYGANTSHALGNNVYSLIEGNQTGSGAGYYATWDTGGIDEFRYTGSSNTTIDLRAATLDYEFGGGGFVSYIEGTIGGRTIASGVVIENATSGSGDDQLTGNTSDNVLSSGGGNDTLLGLSGSDDLFAGLGNDTLDAGAGDGSWQYLEGQAGNDTYHYATEDGRVFVGGNAEAASTGTADRVVFSILNLADIEVETYDYGSSIHGEAIRLTWDDGSGSGELRIANLGEFIETYEFADGSALSSDALL